MTTIKKMLLVFPLVFSLMLVPLAGCASQSPQTEASSSVESSAAESSAASSSSNADSSSVVYSEDVLNHGHLHASCEIDPSALEKAGVDISSLKDYAYPMAISPDLYATAYDALVATGVQVDGSPSYVTSIGGIGEGEIGASSGWMYEVNGETPMVAANECVLQDGDLVRWYYGTWE